jgi:hypothetical protein
MSITPAAATDAFAMDACEHVFVGLKNPGQPCLAVGDCVPGSHCVPNGLEGVCVPYQGEGQICNTSSDCDPDQPQLYCARQDYNCHVRASLGGPCAYTTDDNGQDPRLPLLAECDTSSGKLYCDAVTLVCKTLPGKDAPCLSGQPAGVPPCDPDPTLQLVCDAAVPGGPGICRAPGVLGSDCTRVLCDPDQAIYCDHTSTPPTCQTLPTLDQLCDATERCLAPYVCDGTKAPATCTSALQLGATCTFGGPACDSGLYCNTVASPPVCAPKLGEGLTCTSSVQCASGLCRFTTQAFGKCDPIMSPVVCTGR